MTLQSVFPEEQAAGTGHFFMPPAERVQKLTLPSRRGARHDLGTWGQTLDSAVLDLWSGGGGWPWLLAPEIVTRTLHAVIVRHL